MELVSLYPYDPTARATSNKIVNESITVIPPSQITDYSYVVPRAAPFFAETLVVKDGKGVGARTLVENVDYWCVIDFLSASVGLTKRVSVGIALLDPNYSGTLYVSYQTLGGNYTMADYSVLEELIRERYVVKHVSYEQIINLPAGFSPEWHNHEVADMVGMSSVVTSLEGIKTATGSRNGSYGQIEQQLRNHVNSTSAHTPADIGLGNVKNYGIATLTDAKGGSVSKYITADILKQYVAFDKTDNSVYLLKTDAALTYQTIANMSNYYNKTTSDGRYAYKTDTYTKGQVDALVSGIDASDSLGGYYTKSQSDARYAAKSDLDDYSTTSVADGRYATKLSLNGYYTKVDADGKYALKTQSYTKGESDGRYLSSAALSGYLTQSTADGRYQAKSAMDGYYTKEELNVVKNSSINWMPYPRPDYDYMMQLVVTGPGSNDSDSRMYFNLDKHAKLTDVYTKAEVDSFIREASNSLKVYQRKWTTTTSYRSYSLSTSWIMKYCPSTGTLSLSIIVDSPFYYDEDIVIVFKSGTAPYQTSGTVTAILPIFAFTADNVASAYDTDTWFRQQGATMDVTSNGSFDISVRFSHASSDDNKYVKTLRTILTAGVDSNAKNSSVMQWFNSSHLINIT